MKPSFLYIFLLALVCLQFACTKTNTETIHTVSFGEIENERQKAFGTRTIDEIKENSYFHKITTQLVTTPDTPLKQLLEESKLTIFKKKTTPEAIELWFDRDIIDYTLPEKPNFKYRDVIYFENKQSQSNFNESDSLIKKAILSAKSNNEITNDSVSYTNLAIRDVVVPLPEKVKTRLNCPDCTVEAKKISYIATISNGEGTKKYIAESIISQNVPVLASELSQCLSTLAGVQTIEVLVKQCQEVYDYQ